MDWYFYIACINTTGILVLDIAEKKRKGAKTVVLSANCGCSTQLWKWGPDATLVSKQDNLVLDVTRSFRKSGKTVIANPKKETFNQGWHLVDPNIISNRLDLALDATESSSGVVLQVKAPNKDQSQKWMLVPEHTWEVFEAGFKGDNLIAKTLYYHVAADYIHAILGCTLDDYKVQVQKCVSTINRCSEKLDSVTMRTGFAKTTGGAVTAAGGTAILVGIGMAPFSAGASLVLSVGGAIASVAGGTASVGAKIINQVFEMKEKEEMKQAITPAITATLNFRAFIESYNVCLDKTSSLLKTPHGIHLALKMIEDYKNVISILYTSIAIGKTTFKCASHVKHFTAIPIFKRSIVGVNHLMRISVANQAAAPGIKVFGHSLVSTGSLVAKGVYGSVAVVGLAFGLWDVISGAKQIKGKSEISKEFRDASQNINEISNEFLECFKIMVAESAEDDADTGDDTEIALILKTLYRGAKRGRQHLFRIVLFSFAHQKLLQRHHPP